MISKVHFDICVHVIDEVQLIMELFCIINHKALIQEFMLYTVLFQI